MNSLSWMIYAAGVVEGFKGLFIGAAILGVGGGCIALIVGIIPWHSWSWEDDGVKQKKESARAAFRRYGKQALPVGVLSAMLAAATPGQSTIYLIAASEAGETVIQSPEAQEVFNDLKTIIKSKLKEQLPAQ